jgi:GDP-4-dehydro-6-deoxy-D-mannose reductase
LASIVIRARAPFRAKLIQAPPPFRAKRPVYLSAVRILVTGAGGFVGGHLVENLARAGHEVVAASRQSFAAQGASETLAFDVAAPDAVAEAVARVRPDGVVHLAAQASVPRSWTDPVETYSSNVIGASNLLEALRPQPATRVVLVGSAQVYGDGVAGRLLSETDPLVPRSPYAVSKIAQELVGLLYHRELGIPVVLARSFNHTGPGQSEEYAVGSFASQVAAIEAGERPPRLEVGWLGAIRDFLDVRDVVEAYRLLLERGGPGEAYNVSSGKGLPVGELLDKLLDAAGLASAVEVVQSAPPRTGDPGALIGENAKIRQAVGWEPRIPIEQSLADTLTWYRSRTARRAP